MVLLFDLPQKLEKEGQNVLLRSQYEKFKAGTNIYVVDTLGTNSFLLTDMKCVMHENILLLRIETREFLELLSLTGLYKLLKNGYLLGLD